MNLDKEVKIGGEVINPKGALLTLSAQESVRVIGGRPLFASGIAKDLDEVCQEAGLDARALVRVNPFGFEVLSQWITMLAPLFLLGGMIGAYLEFKSPGFGVAGVLSAICFLLFFTGHYIAGLAGLEVVAIFAVGAIMILIELVFFPGVVVVAALGAALIAGALFFAMVDFYPAQPLEFSFDLLALPMLNLGIAVAASVLCIALLARFLPDLPLFRRLFLSAQSIAGPSLPTVASSSPFAVGDTGMTQTILRPSGKAVFGKVLADVVADGQFIEVCTPVRILSISGDRVVVEPV
jgi:membrane-bound serine protease (ClpP class)